jgi:hypothetical protein
MVDADWRVLHVANGHCTAGLIHEAGLPGRAQIWADPLHDGPVPDLSDDELVRARAAFLASPPDSTAQQVEADLRGWRAVVDNHDGYDELVLWFEHDLFDQLNLIQLLARIGRDRPVPAPVSLVSIDRFPGHPDFQGFGELSPPELASLFPSRQRVTAQQFATAARAWDAFRGTDPGRIAAFLTEDTPALPFLAAALRRYLEEQPSGPDALTRSERRLLAQLAGGPMDIRSAWRGMHAGEDVYFITDTAFWRLISGLASRSPALINVIADHRSAAVLPRGTLTLAS